MRKRNVILLESRLTEIEDLADSMIANTTEDLERMIIEQGHTLTYEKIEQSWRGYVTADKRVVIDRDKAYGRGLNFVLAHELGHIVLNHFQRSSEHFRNKDGHPYSVEFEQEANFFAAYLLVPRRTFEYTTSIGTKTKATYYMNYGDEEYDNRVSMVMSRCLGSRAVVQYVLEDHVRYSFGMLVGLPDEEAA